MGQLSRAVFAVALLIVVSAGLYWFLGKLFRDWLPPELVGYIAVAIVFLALGLIWGDKSVRAQLAQGEPVEPIDPLDPFTTWRGFRRTLRGIAIYAAGALTFVFLLHVGGVI